MGEPDPRIVVLVIVGIICLAVLLLSPLGAAIGFLIGLIPWALWKWILGIAAAIGLYFVVQALRN